jgi:DNA-binding response OmpR family regulator
MGHTDKPTILVADDNDASRYATARVIRKEGYPVMEVATGGEVLDMAGTGPGLVVLDVNLPDLDGFEVCRKLKENPSTAHIPVLYLSATFLDSASKAKGLNSGGDAYLTQPVEPPVLLATIGALLRMKRAEEKMAEQLKELQQWHDVMLDRENRIIELKREVNELLKQVGKEEKYKIME